MLTVKLIGLEAPCQVELLTAVPEEIKPARVQLTAGSVLTASQLANKLSARGGLTRRLNVKILTQDSDQNLPHGPGPSRTRVVV